METIKIIGFVGLGMMVAAFISLFYFKYMEAKFARQWAEELEREAELLKESHSLEKKALIKEAQKWEKLATSPIISSSDPMPIIINRSNIKKIAVRYELEAGKTRDYATQKGIYEIMKAITPFVITEFSSEFGREIMYQDLYVATIENN